MLRFFALVALLFSVAIGGAMLGYRLGENRRSALEFCIVRSVRIRMLLDKDVECRDDAEFTISLDRWDMEDEYE